MDKEKEYQRICEKLGFIPSEYEYDGPLTEDDTWVNPFSVLTSEESIFLYENGYLNKQQIPPVIIMAGGIFIPIFKKGKVKSYEIYRSVKRNEGR